MTATDFALLILGFNLTLTLMGLVSWWRNRRARRQPMSSMRVLRDEDFRRRADPPHWTRDPSPRGRAS